MEAWHERSSKCKPLGKVVREAKERAANAMRSRPDRIQNEMTTKTLTRYRKIHWQRNFQRIFRLHIYYVHVFGSYIDCVSSQRFSFLLHSITMHTHNYKTLPYTLTMNNNRLLSSYIIWTHLHSPSSLPIHWNLCVWCLCGVCVVLVSSLRVAAKRRKPFQIV